jgi:hypothetical protein
LHLETPQVAAFALILVMSVGNYLGTRYTVSALLYAAALLTIVVSSWSESPAWLINRPVVRFWCTFLIAIAVCMTSTSSRRAAQTRFDHLWFDFFDTFGIVWGRRIQDRVNFIAKKEGWPSRLELDGFVRLDGLEPANSDFTPGAENLLKLHKSLRNQDSIEADTDSRIEHTLRWLLRRFVVPTWIDERIGHSRQSQGSELPVDS